MPIEYTNEQANILRERMSFLKNMRACIVVAAIFFFALLITGCMLIYNSLAFWGVILIIIVALPCFLSSKFISYANILISSLKKHNYATFKVYVKTSNKLDGNGMWHEVVTEDDMKMYYYCETPNKDVMPGTMLHAVVCKSKKSLMFLVDPIEQPKIANTSGEVVEEA